jgi:hypothetical protein
MTGIPPRSLSLLLRRTRLLEKRRKMMHSISACCEMASCGKSIASCLEDRRAERWHSRLRQLLGKAHPFRSAHRASLALSTRILILSEQLFYYPKDAAAPTAPPHAAARNTLTFVSAPQPEASLAGQGEDTVTVLEHTFLAASENGFVLSREAEMAWTCIAPGAQARLAW